jgi:hypothetical protein
MICVPFNDFYQSAIRLYGFLMISCILATFINENGIFIDEN